MRTRLFTSFGQPLALALLLGFSLNASAQTTVDDAWVRATVPQQPSTGAFMRLTASTDSKLVGVQSPVAGIVQIHQSSMVNDVMSMKPVAEVALPAGKTVAIDPEGYHIMLINLTGPIKEGDAVPLTLIVEDDKGEKETIEVTATARALNAPEHGGMHMH
ncbi:copper chaperone PCu(A)C [Xanthomonas sp. WHRI 1810A]|uniref:copper chaperone PCu(A)C n=1 Tax=Xanthomonas sp. WHRI 1810A TaxID=3161565 RepID=UPI0032E87856